MLQSNNRSINFQSSWSRNKFFCITLPNFKCNLQRSSQLSHYFDSASKFHWSLAEQLHVSTMELLHQGYSNNCQIWVTSIGVSLVLLTAFISMPSCIRIFQKCILLFYDLLPHMLTFLDVPVHSHSLIHFRHPI